MRMHGENVPKCRVTWCCMSITLFPLQQIAVAEHVAESGI